MHGSVPIAFSIGYILFWHNLVSSYFWLSRNYMYKPSFCCKVLEVTQPSAAHAIKFNFLRKNWFYMQAHGLGKVSYTSPNKLELQSRTTSAQGKLVGRFFCTDLTFPIPGIGPGLYFWHREKKTLAVSSLLLLIWDQNKCC